MILQPSNSSSLRHSARILCTCCVSTLFFLLALSTALIIRVHLILQPLVQFVTEISTVINSPSILPLSPPDQLTDLDTSVEITRPSHLLLHPALSSSTHPLPLHLSTRYKLLRTAAPFHPPHCTYFYVLATKEFLTCDTTSQAAACCGVGWFCRNGLGSYPESVWSLIQSVQLRRSFFRVVWVSKRWNTRCHLHLLL